jgi:hypothetical protein
MADKNSEPQLLAPHAHRSLIYIERLNSVGVQPARADVDRFSTSEGPRGAQYAPNALAALATSLAVAQSLVAPTRKIADAEPVSGWLVRMGWVDVTADDRLVLTSLGAALVSALRQNPSDWAPEREGSGAIVLQPDNAFVYVELTRSISQAGAALLVDPYFKIDMLEWLLNATGVTRLLMSSSSGAQAREVEHMGLALSALQANPNLSRVAIRATMSATLHDRCIAKEDGAVLLLGTSITGIGRHLSTIVPLPSSAALALRREVEKLWKTATPVVPKAVRVPPGRPNTAEVTDP